MRAVRVATTLVLLFAAAAQADPAPYQFVGRPIAVVQPSSDCAVFQARFRLTRRLPIDRQGVAADVTLGGAGADAPAVPFGVRSRHGYAAVIGTTSTPPGCAGRRRAGA